MKISDIAIAVFVGFVLIFALFKRTEVYPSFILGAEDGLKTAVKIIPQLVGLMVAIKAFNASGAMDYIVALIKPVADILHFPSEALPFALLRPVSGSGSLAMATDIFGRYGADSFAGRVASVMMGSTETTFYVISVYFGAVGVKNVRHTLLCALLADVFSMVLSTVVCALMF
jgi:spore maturation protein B